MSQNDPSQIKGICSEYTPVLFYLTENRYIIEKFICGRQSRHHGFRHRNYRRDHCRQSCLHGFHRRSYRRDCHLRSCHCDHHFQTYRRGHRQSYRYGCRRSSVGVEDWEDGAPPSVDAEDSGDVFPQTNVGVEGDLEDGDLWEEFLPFWVCSGGDTICCRVYATREWDDTPP